MFVKRFLSYSQYIDWFFICSILYVVSFHFNYCSLYGISCFTRSDYFVWLWNDYYFLFSSLIDSLLALTWRATTCRVSTWHDSICLYLIWLDLPSTCLDLTLPMKGSSSSPKDLKESMKGSSSPFSKRSKALIILQ